jgi:hypothetical protein
VCNCLIDEGRPLGIGWQEQVPNHLRQLWSKAMVARLLANERRGEDHTAPQGLFRRNSLNLARSSRSCSMPSLLCNVSIWALPALF